MAYSEDAKCAVRDESISPSVKLINRIEKISDSLNRLDDLTIQRLSKYQDCRPQSVETVGQGLPRKELIGNSPYYMNADELLTTCESLIRGISNRITEVEL